MDRVWGGKCPFSPPSGHLPLGCGGYSQAEFGLLDLSDGTLAICDFYPITYVICDQQYLLGSGHLYKHAS